MFLAEVNFSVTKILIGKLKLTFFVAWIFTVACAVHNWQLGY